MGEGRWTNSEVQAVSTKGCIQPLQVSKERALQQQWKSFHSDWMARKKHILASCHLHSLFSITYPVGHVLHHHSVGERQRSCLRGQEDTASAQNVRLISWGPRYMRIFWNATRNHQKGAFFDECGVMEEAKQRSATLWVRVISTVTAVPPSFSRMAVISHTFVPLSSDYPISSCALS